MGKSHSSLVASRRRLLQAGAGLVGGGLMPAALVLNRINPIMVQGAALADFTMISGFDVDITSVVPNGALIEVDPETAVLRVLADA